MFLGRRLDNEISFRVYFIKYRIHAITPITDFIEKKNIIAIPKVPKIKFSHQIT